jgi:hypothetical protein
MLGGILQNVTKMLGPAGLAIDILSSLMSAKKSGGAESSSGGIDIGQLQSARQNLQAQLGQFAALRQQLSIGQDGSISISMSAQPMPFSAAPGSPMAEAMKNPLGGLGALKDLFSKLMPALEQAIGQLSGQSKGAASGGAASSGASAPSGASEGASASNGGSEILSSESKWGNIDSMMAEAEKLAMSKNPSDQLKAQKMMQQAQQMFQTISKMLQQLSEMFRTAIGNVK